MKSDDPDYIRTAIIFGVWFVSPFNVLLSCLCLVFAFPSSLGGALFLTGVAFIWLGLYSFIPLTGIGAKSIAEGKRRWGKR